MRPKDLVAAGYNRIADHYAEWPCGADIRARYLARLTGLVPPGGRVLDLGCGNGIPVARDLSALAHVVGIDVSPRQIELARRNVPAGHFIAADMMDVELAAGEYDAVCAFFSVTHVPRRLHSELFARVRAWLGDGGWFLASLGAGDEPDSVEPNWLGAPMFFSHFDAATNCDLIRAAGLQLVESAIVAHDEAGRTATFLWVIARKA